MAKKRPVSFNLLALHFPITAVASILHRISGFILFLLIPVFLGVLAVSLQSVEGFTLIHNGLTHPLTKLLLSGFLLALFYHLLAGIRHLVMDMGCCESLKQARFTSSVVMALALISTAMMTIYLW